MFRKSARLSSIMAPLLVLLSFVVLIYLHILNAKKTNSIKAKLPPSPPKFPIIGNLRQLGKLPHPKLGQLSQKYDPAMLLQLGNVPTLVISSAEMAKEVLQTHDKDFCSRPNSPGLRKIFYNFSDVAFSPYTDHWHKRRKIFVSHVFNSKRTQFFWEAREIEITHLIDSISLASGKLVRVAFGKSYRGKQVEGQMLKDVLDETMDVLSSFAAEDFFPFIGKMIDTITGHRRRLNCCFSKVDGYLQQVLDDKPKDGYLQQVLEILFLRSIDSVRVCKAQYGCFL